MFSTIMDLVLISALIIAMFNMVFYLGEVVAEYWEEIFHG